MDRREIGGAERELSSESPKKKPNIRKYLISVLLFNSRP